MSTRKPTHMSVRMSVRMSMHMSLCTSVQALVPTSAHIAHPMRELRMSPALPSISGIALSVCFGRRCPVMPHRIASGHPIGMAPQHHGEASRSRLIRMGYPAMSVRVHRTYRRRCRYGATPSAMPIWRTDTKDGLLESHEVCLHRWCGLVRVFREEAVVRLELRQVLRIAPHVCHRDLLPQRVV